LYRGRDNRSFLRIFTDLVDRRSRMHKVRRVRIFSFMVVVALGACGSKKEEAPGCEPAVDNAIKLSRDAIPDDKTAAKAREVSLARCNEDKWADETRRCLVAAKVAGDVAKCGTPAERKKLEEAVAAAMMGSDPGSGSDVGSGSGSAGSGSAMGSGSGSAGSGSAAKGSGSGSAVKAGSGSGSSAGSGSAGSAAKPAAGSGAGSGSAAKPAAGSGSGSAPKP
jgi:hypothetical protein